jgi:hypothetical protein
MTGQSETLTTRLGDGVGDAPRPDIHHHRHNGY